MFRMSMLPFASDEDDCTCQSSSTCMIVNTSQFPVAYDGACVGPDEVSTVYANDGTILQSIDLGSAGTMRFHGQLFNALDAAPAERVSGTFAGTTWTWDFVSANYAGNTISLVEIDLQATSDFDLLAVGNLTLSRNIGGVITPLWSQLVQPNPKRLKAMLFAATQISNARTITAGASQLISAVNGFRVTFDSQTGVKQVASGYFPSRGFPDFTNAYDLSRRSVNF